MKRFIVCLAILYSTTLIADEISFPNSRTGKELTSSRWTGPESRHIHLDIGLLFEQLSFNNQSAGFSYRPYPPTISSFETDVSQEVKVLHTSFEYALGFTASACYRTNHDSWYVGANFEFLSANISELFDSKNYSFVYYEANENISEAAYIDIFEYLKMRYISYSSTMNTYCLDVFLSNGRYVSGKYSFTPRLGVQALWFSTGQKEELPTYLYDTIFPDWDMLILYNETADNWGAGPYVGLENRYFFNDSFSLFSDSSVALLTGESRLNRYSLGEFREKDTLTIDFAEYYTDNLNQSYINYLYLRSILGVAYGKYIRAGSQYLQIKIGYDVKGIISYPDSARGYSANGLIANMEWSF